MSYDTIFLFLWCLSICTKINSQNNLNFFLKIHIFIFEKRLQSLYIINYVLHVQDEALYRLSYTNLRNENIQLSYTIIELAI